MKILIIRHGDPDYSIDSLTPQGHVEAKLLAEKMANVDVKAFYVSPLGRARKTAEYTLNKIGREAEVCDWLQEFPAKVDKPHEKQEVAWDWRPKDWTAVDDFYDLSKWSHVSQMEQAGVPAAYAHVTEEFDKLLAKHGYVREGRYYRAVNANEDTIVLFCHFGLECVLLSHLLGISPMLLWHGFCAAPTSVTTVVTEERERGIAYFRTLQFGDVSHLYMGGEEPAFAARFCETYDTPGQRRD